MRNPYEVIFKSMELGNMSNGAAERNTQFLVWLSIIRRILHSIVIKKSFFFIRRKSNNRIILQKLYNHFAIKQISWFHAHN